MRVKIFKIQKTLLSVKKNQHQPQSSITCYVLKKHYKLKIVQVYAPYSQEDIDNFNNNVDETLGKPNHNIIVMGDCNAQLGKRTNPMESATGKFGLDKRKRRHLGKMGIIKKVKPSTKSTLEVTTDWI